MALFENLFQSQAPEPQLPGPIKQPKPKTNGKLFSGLFAETPAPTPAPKVEPTPAPTLPATKVLPFLPERPAPVVSEKKPPLGFLGRAVQKGADVFKGVFEETKGRIKEFQELQDIEKFPGKFPTKEAVARTGRLITGGVNIGFAPFTAGLEAAKEVPLLKYPAKAVSFAFEKAGELGAKAGEFVVDRLPISQESKDIFKPIVSEIGAVVTQIGGAKVAGVGVAKVRQSIFTKVAERQKAGVEVTPEEAKRIVNETAKENRIKGKEEVVEVAKERVATDQKVLIENFLKGEEKINYKLVKGLGKDIEGRPITARFEYDYKTGASTIYTTSKTSASSLAHELGHYFDRKLSTKVGERLSDLIPDYERNKPQIEASLTRFAVEKLGGEATHQEITTQITKFLESFKADIERLSKARGEVREGFGEQFASAVAQVIRNPQMAKLRAPQFAGFIDIMLKNTGILETRIKNIAEQGKTQVITPQPIEGAKAELRAEGQIILERRDVLKGEKAKAPKIKEEEVKGKDQIVYHGATAADIKSIKEGIKASPNKPFHVAVEKSSGDLYAKARGSKLALEVELSKKAKIYEPTETELETLSQTFDFTEIGKRLKKEGYDAMYFDDTGIFTGEYPEIVIFNREVVKLKAGEAVEAKEVSGAEKEKIIAPEGKQGVIIEGKKAEIAGTGLKTGKFVEGRKAYNPEKINAPEDVEALFKGVSEAGGEFRKQRISKADEDIKALAQEVGVSVQDLMNAQPGSIANAETVFKARQLVSDLAQDLRDTIRKIMTETASQPELQEVKTKLFRLQGSMKSIAGFRTEASNVFRQFKLEARAGENDIMTDLVSALKKIDKESGTDLGSFLKQTKELLEPTAADKAWHLWYMSILSGESTQIKNFGGNFAQMVGEVAVEAVTSPRGFRTSMAGLFKGLTDGFGEFKRIMREGDVSKFEERGIKPVRFIFGQKETRPFVKQIKVRTADLLNAFDYVGRFMAGIDGWARMGFKGMEMIASARERAIAEGLKGEKVTQRIQELVDKPLEEMIEQADKFAARGTYTQRPTGFLGLLVEGINRMTSLSAKDKLEATAAFKALKEKRFEEVKVGAIGKAATKGVARTIVPFSRIVANVVNNSLDWTPLGFAREGLPTKGLQAVFGGRKSLSRPQRQQLGRAVIGTIGMVYAASLAMEDRLSGNGPSDNKRRQQLKDSGWRENSIRFGDHWYPYQNWGPPAVGLTIVGNWNDSIKYGNFGEEESNERLVAAIMGSVNSVLDMSFLSGLADLITAVQNYDRGGERYAKRYIAQQITSFVPNIVKQTARYFDPTQFEADSVGEYIRSNLRLTGGLKPRLNVFGEPIKGERLTELEPVKVTDDPVIKFLSGNDLWISVPSKSTKLRKAGERESRVMSEDEYYNYVKISGQLIKQRIQRDMNVIKSLPADKQQDRVDDIVRDVRDEAKRKIEFGIGL